MSDVIIHGNSHMTSGRIEIITSVERRRRWSAAEKERLVAATLEPGAKVTAVAREAGIAPGQLYGWRRQQLRARAPNGFVPVRIAPGATAAEGASGGTIAIDFAFGARVRITGAVDAATLTATVAALLGGGRR
jgi:transposase